MSSAVFALLAAASAAAEDRAAEVPFTIATPAGRFEFRAFPAPPPRALPREARTCAVRLAWTGSVLTVHDAGCPAAVAPEVLFTLGAWRVEGPASPSEVGEVWFVYPTDHPAEPRLLVRQSAGRELSLPHGVDAVPFEIRAWSFLRYPADAHRAGLPDVTCTVHVEADVKGYTTSVEVEDCAEPYRQAAMSAVRAWRFAPISVEGGDIGTALTLRTTFVAAGPDEAEEPLPSDESARLWAARQFAAMSKDDRIWFIRAALIGPDARDLGPGQVKVTLPAAPDLGAREAPKFIRQAYRPPARPLPDHDPILRLGAPERPEIEVYELALPSSPVSRPATCPVLVQVDGERQVFAWAEASCDDEVRSVSLRAADEWVLRHGGTQDHATRHRFRATFRYDAGRTELVLPADHVRTERGALPAGVHTLLGPRPISRPPPKLPRAGPMPEGECELDVAVSLRGRPGAIEVVRCPDGVIDLALRSVKKWRWAPAEEDGVPIEAVTRVSIHFRP